VESRELEVDMLNRALKLKRFEVNFPVLFANQGCDMMAIKMDLQRDDAKAQDCEDLIDRLAWNVDAIKTMSKVSPNLSAVNTAALMVAQELERTRGSEDGTKGAI
jgi:hypothetical protein